MNSTLEKKDTATSLSQAQRFCQLGKAVISTEAAAVEALINRIDQNFSHACELLLQCSGRIIVIGMGKSGHIGGKIAATFASTGSPAFFVHPGEASHGDLGMITHKDVVLMISNSGETEEILAILPIIKRLSVPLISMTGAPQSTLARISNVHLNVSITKEACPLGLAPTASTTAALAMGDALAIALLEVRGFTEQDFALSHPGGTLGKRLLLYVSDVMCTGEAIPLVHSSALLAEALLEMTSKNLGMVIITDDHQRIVGIYTDGDLRRTIAKNINFNTTKIAQVMEPNCKTVHADILAAEALEMMQKYKVNGFAVVDQEQRPIGAFNMQNLLRYGVF